VSARIVYDGKQFRVAIENDMEIVRHPGSTAIVAIHEGAIVLVRQQREPAKRRLVELPAGTLEQGEEPLRSAQRELEEEVGLKGGRWRAVEELERRLDELEDLKTVAALLLYLRGR
jgi:ADP-ribose pyrophosphatase